MRVDGCADVAIQGAGPVGCTLALLLQRQGRSVVLVRPRKEAPAAPAFRPIALSHASRLILERAGAWGRLSPTPITAIHVSQQGGFGRTRMSAADAGVPALGYVVDYAALLEALLALRKRKEHPVPGRARRGAARRPCRRNVRRHQRARTTARRPWSRR